MHLHSRFILCSVPLLALGLVYAQREFRSYSFEDEAVPLPADAGEKTEWAFARLQYSSAFGRWGRGSWATDYPKADRQFVLGVRRLTRIPAPLKPSVKQTAETKNKEHAIFFPFYIHSPFVIAPSK